MMWSSLFGMGSILLITALLQGGMEEDPSTKSKKSRLFVGSLQVPPERRDEVLKMLKVNKLLGAQIPPDSAPETIIYIGTKAEYETVQDATNRLLFPQYYDPTYKVKSLPKKLVPRKDPEKK